MAIITDEQSLRDCVEYYLTQPEFVFDVETIGEDRAVARTATVVWISLAAGGRSDTIPMGHPHGELLRRDPVLSARGSQRRAAGIPIEEMNPKYDFLKETVPVFGPPPVQLERLQVFDALQPLFFSDALKIGHNIKFDLHAVAKYYDGARPDGPYYDTLIASWLPDVTRKGHLTLDECYKRETGGTLVKGVGANIALHSFSDVAQYSLLDAEATWELKRALDAQYTRSYRLARLLDLEMEVLYPVLEMESAGFSIDRAVLSEIDRELQDSIDAIQGQIYLAAGRPFNIRSNRDKQRLLFSPKSEGGFGFMGTRILPSSSDKPSREIGPEDYAVDREALEKLSHGKADRNDFVRLLLRHTAKTKLHSTYVLPYLGGTTVAASGKEKKVESKIGSDGHVYAQFVQHGAESGRFSSRSPNLQNIPSRTAEGKRLREIFVSDPGCTLVVADYSQIEPRIIASLSRDTTMIRTYKDGGDVYQAVADRMQVSRSDGKELVLSIAYGVGAERIASRIDRTPKEARDLMDYFADRFPDIIQHRHMVINRAKSDRYAETIFGRRRPLPAIAWSDRGRQAEAERQAYNHLIQGSAADIMKIALVNIHSALPDRTSILATVHDEVIVQAPDDMVDEVSEIVRIEMESAGPRQIVVPLIADVSHGNSWGRAKQ